MIYEYNTWVEAPKSSDLLNQIRKYCVDTNTTIHKLESVPVNNGIFDRMLGINRETVYFHISNDRKEVLEHLKNQLSKK